MNNFDFLRQVVSRKKKVPPEEQNKRRCKPYPEVRGRIPTFLPYPYQKLVRERNVYGSIWNFSTGTERGRVFFENEVRVREVDGLFFKSLVYGNGTGTGEFQKLSTGTGFSTEVVRNTKIITIYITSDFLTFLKVKIWSLLTYQSYY